MKTAIQQCAQDLFETDLSHEAKKVIVDILHKHLVTEKQQILDSNNAGYQAHRKDINQNAFDYYNETFETFNQ